MRFAYYLIGSLICLLLRRLLRILCLSLEYPESDESDESNEEEFEELVSESGLFGTCGTSLGELLRSVEFLVCLRLAGDDGSFGGGGGGG